MQIFHYAIDTGALIGAGWADPDPLVEGNWLIPAYATSIEPPVYVEGQVRVFRDGGWGYIPEQLPEPDPEPEPEPEPEPDPEPTFEAIEPVPFWRAAFDMFGMKKTDIYEGIEDPDQRYLIELSIEGRKTYRRYDDTVIMLADMKGFPPEQMDTIWLFVQEHYK